MNIFRLFFSFEGRIGRVAWWLAVTARFIVLIPMFFIIKFFINSAKSNVTSHLDLSEIGVVILIAFVIIWFWSAFAVEAKRWHDRNKSARWVLLPLVPIVGGVWALVELGFLAGAKGSNFYSPMGKSFRRSPVPLTIPVDPAQPEP